MVHTFSKVRHFNYHREYKTIIALLNNKDILKEVVEKYWNVTTVIKYSQVYISGFSGMVKHFKHSQLFLETINS